MRPEVLRLWNRRGAYREVFGTDQGRAVLADLKKFCAVDGALFDPDPRFEAFRLGRREVWLRLKKFLDLTDEQILKLEEPDT